MFDMFISSTQNEHYLLVLPLFVAHLLSIVVHFIFLSFYAFDVLIIFSSRFMLFGAASALETAWALDVFVAEGFFH